MTDDPEELKCINSISALPSSLHTLLAANQTMQLIADKDDKQSLMFDRNNPSSPTASDVDSTAVLGERKHSTRCANIKHLPIKRVVPQLDQPGSSVRGQMDTRATVSCSNAKHLFHNCEECSKKDECPIRLCAVGNTTMPTQVSHLKAKGAHLHLL